MKITLRLAICFLLIAPIPLLSQTSFNAIEITHFGDDSKVEILKISDLVKQRNSRTRDVQLLKRGKGELIEVTESSYSLQHKGQISEYMFENTDQLMKWKREREWIGYGLLAAETIVFIAAVAQTDNDGFLGNIDAAAYTIVYFAAAIPPLILATGQKKHKSGRWGYKPVYKE